MPAQLEIQIGADIRQAEKALAAVEKELKSFGREVDKAVDSRGVARFTQEIAKTKSAVSGLKGVGAGGFDDFTTKANAARNAGFAFNQILREAPAAGINFQTFILAISNNLPIFADRVRDAGKAGLSGGQIFKELGKSLVSIPGILSLATTAFLLLGDTIFGGSKKANEFSKELNDLSEAGDKAKDAIEGLNREIDFLIQLNSINIGARFADAFEANLIRAGAEFISLRDKAFELETAIVKQTDVAGKAYREFADNVSQSTLIAADAFGSLTSIPDDFIESLSSSEKKYLKVAKKTAQDLADLQSDLTKNRQAQDIRAANTRLAKAEEERKRQKEAADAYKKYVNDTIARAKELAAFFNRITLRDIEFDTDPRDSLEKTFDRAKKFIDQVLNRRDTFRFKPVILVEPTELNNLEQAFTKMRDSLRKNSVKDLAAVQKEVNRLTASNPILIQSQLFIDTNRIRGEEFAAALGLNTAQTLLGDVQKSAVFAANAIKGVLTPAFQSLFSAIVAGESPIKAFFDSLGQAVLQLIQKLIQAAVQALILSAILPGGFTAGGKTFKGFGDIFGNLIGFAAGGLVFGPTIGMIGEGVGTSKTNPEVIAPLDQLKKFLAPQAQGNSRQSVVIRGRSLVLVTERERRAQRRATGR